MAKKKTAAKTRLVGFARLRVTDPDKLREISQKAGKSAQKKYGKRIRWTKTEARAQAARGGKAVQRRYRAEGHPLQIAQMKREAISRKIREGMRKRKQKQPETSKHLEQIRIEEAVARQEEGGLREAEPGVAPKLEQEKDVANG